MFIGILVASFAEAWIEITLAGIKRLWKAHVASFAEAWIEIYSPDDSANKGTVASFAEAWIEI